MNAIQVFINPKFGTVRTTQDDEGNIVFCGKDIAEALGYKDTTNAIKQHCRGVVFRHPIEDSKGRLQDTKFITEPDLYRLIVSSRLPQAQDFERWVFEEVLPAIRRHGGYIPHKPHESTEETLARALTIAQDIINETRAQLEAQKPKVRLAEAIANSDDLYLVSDLAKSLYQQGIPVGQNRLFEMLRVDGFLCRQEGAMWNTPTQKSIEMGLFKLTKRVIVTGNRTHTSNTPKLTGKGFEYFMRRYAGDRYQYTKAKEVIYNH